MTQEEKIAGRFKAKVQFGFEHSALTIETIDAGQWINATDIDDIQHLTRWAATVFARTERL